MNHLDPNSIYKSTTQGHLSRSGQDTPAPESAEGKTPDNGRHGVVAIVYEAERLLVIRRSPLVRAPNLICLPGGGIEAGETFEEAMCREMKEELNLPISVDRHLWTSVTRWGTKLEWMVCSRIDASEPQPNPWEVSEYLWLTLEELRTRDDLLGSLPDFLTAISRKEIHWP